MHHREFFCRLKHDCYAAFPPSCDPLRTPRLSIRSWSWDFFEILGFLRSDAGRYGLIRFVALGCNMITNAQFLMTRSATILSLLQRRTDARGQVCPDRVHDGMQTWYDHHDQGCRFGMMWHAYIRSDAFISNRYALLWQDTIVVQMSFTIPIKIWATIWPEGYIYSPTDYRLHCGFQDLLQS